MIPVKYFFTLITILSLIGCIIFTQLPPKTTVLETTQEYRYTVLLLPLDSRPACTKFIVDLGKIANIKVIMPPKELLDNYKKTAKTNDLRIWLSGNIQNVDATIVSIDMLIHGSLLASRHSTGTDNDANETLQILESIHIQYPQMPIYAFNILPRLWLADSSENSKYEKLILEYSKLKDQVYTFENPKDIKKLNDLENKIPSQILTQYQNLYQENIELNKKLIQLTKRGVFEKLVIGQDDGQIFGIPNISKKQLLHYLNNQQLTSDNVVITRGTDEVALTLLGDIANKLNHYHPKINVQYSDTEASRIVMPYMPSSVATTVKEKVDMIGGSLVDNPDDADFILFVYIGTEENNSNRFNVNKRIQALLKKKYKVALVDLSEHFSYKETIFPLLLKNDVPINQLIAYAGWNTASNSIGTAVTQATIFTARLNSAVETNDILSLYKNNLSFLISRYLEDWYYLKNVIDNINNNLKKSNINAYDLNEHYNMVNEQLNIEMNKNAYLLSSRKAFNIPLLIQTQDQIIAVKASNLRITTYFPWSRTFEIYLDSQITLEKLENNRSKS
jgi:hypothetical protein